MIAFLIYEDFRFLTLAAFLPSTRECVMAHIRAQGDFAGLVDIGDGRRLYLEFRGTGGPTVILLSGYGNAADMWSFAEAHPPAVLEGVASFTRVCAYDRPGSLIATTAVDGSVIAASAPLAGRSDPAPMPRTAADVVAELHTLLAAAHVTGPYVLAAHSLGGAFANLYARTHSDQVVGLVLVDPAQPFIRALFPPQEWKVNQEIGLRPQMPIPGYEQEIYDQDANYNQIEAAPPLRPMPVTILVRDKSDPVTSDLPADLAAVLSAMNGIWSQAQAGFAASIPGARLITVPGTTHYIHTQRPDAVIDAVREVTAQVAFPRPTKT